MPKGLLRGEGLEGRGEGLGRQGDIELLLGPRGTAQWEEEAFGETVGCRAVIIYWIKGNSLVGGRIYLGIFRDWTM